MFWSWHNENGVAYHVGKRRSRTPAKPSTRLIVGRTWLGPRRAVMQAWADDDKDADNVVAFERRA
jgi:hypothetical protein